MGSSDTDLRFHLRVVHHRFHNFSMLEQLLLPVPNLPF